MDKTLIEVVKIDKKDSVEEKELFSKVQDFLKADKTEYPNFALTTMIMDSFASGASIFKSTKKIENNSPIQENFVEV